MHICGESRIPVFTVKKKNDTHASLQEAKNIRLNFQMLFLGSEMMGDLSCPPFA